MKNLIIILFVLTSCQPEYQAVTLEKLTGIWMAGSLQLDMDYYVPFNQVMQINTSSEIQYAQGSETDTFQSLILDPDSIFFPYQKYDRKEVSMIDDQLKMGYLYPRIFKRARNAPLKMEDAVIRSRLMQGNWKSNREILDFKQTTLFEADLNSNVKTSYCWQVYRVKDLVFLKTKDDFKGCEEPFSEVAQIIKVTEDSLVLEKWSGHSFKTLAYELTKASVENVPMSSFRLCNPYLYENSWSSWYFFKYSGFEGGLYELTKIFNDKYQKVTGDNIDGHIRAQFIINCEGQMGQLQLLEMNESYELSKLHPDISSQIEEILTHAGPWVAGERRGQILDTYKFLIFRIKNGEIDEIYP
ncbi:hypothetical protein [Portibacter marinus]|uniref:hypothetical protein n=1 Tax=Portibacter marinus TaxID=2898660 RepID=UPI001F30FB54|nr:hypothetical protein [Portibacter marinus]